MSPTVCFLAFFFNLTFILAMYLAQQLDKSLPPRHSLIPFTRQKFIYMQDFHTMLWGDMLGLTFTNIAFWHLVWKHAITTNQLAMLVVVAGIDAFLFAKMCLGPNHKPDQGYPRVGQIGWNGIAHLPYHGINVGMCVLLMYQLIIGNLRGPLMWTTLIGVAIYLAAFLADIRADNFDPLKRISR